MLESEVIDEKGMGANWKQRNQYIIYSMDWTAQAIAKYE